MQTAVIFSAFTLAVTTAAHRLIAPQHKGCDPVHKNPPSPSFCHRPPTVKLVDQHFSGKWYAIYASGAATRIASNRCITSDNSVVPAGNMTVNECFTPQNEQRKCSASDAWRADESRPGALTVYSPEAPLSPLNPGQYNVVGILRAPLAGYFAYAVYQCVVPPAGPPVSGLFILSRTTWLRGFNLRKMQSRLKCAGFDVSGDFVEIDNRFCDLRLP